MNKKKIEYFSVSQSGILIREGKALILQDSKPHRKWLLPGGRIDVDENCDTAFEREISEELGIKKFEIVAIVDFDTWYYGDEKIPQSAIVRLIKNDVDAIRISDEHVDYKWISEKEIDEFEFVWPNAPRMIRRAFKEYKRK